MKKKEFIAKNPSNISDRRLSLIIASQRSVSKLRQPVLQFPHPLSPCPTTRTFYWTVETKLGGKQSKRITETVEALPANKTITFKLLFHCTCDWIPFHYLLKAFRTPSIILDRRSESTIAFIKADRVRAFSRWIAINNVIERAVGPFILVEIDDSKGRFIMWTSSEMDGRFRLHRSLVI